MIMHLYRLYDQALERQDEYGLTDSELVTLAYLLEILHTAGRPSVTVPLVDIAKTLGLSRDTLRSHLRHLDRVLPWLRLVLSGTHVVIHIWPEYIAENTGKPPEISAGENVQAPE